MPKAITQSKAAEILGMPYSTFKTRKSRHPDEVPPTFKLPGVREPMTFEETVQEFILAQAAKAGVIPPS